MDLRFDADPLISLCETTNNMKTALLLIILCLPFLAVFGDESERFVAKRSDFLNSIVIPVVELKDATIREALDFAWARAIEIDVTNMDSSRRGVALLLRYPSGEMYPRRSAVDLDPPKNPKKNHIVFHARNISLSDLFKELARQTGYDIYTTSVGVVFCPPGTSPFPNANSSKGEVWERIFVSSVDPK